MRGFVSQRVAKGIIFSSWVTKRSNEIVRNYSSLQTDKVTSIQIESKLRIAKLRNDISGFSKPHHPEIVAQSLKTPEDIKFNFPEIQRPFFPFPLFFRLPISFNKCQLPCSIWNKRKQKYGTGEQQKVVEKVQKLNRYQAPGSSAMALRLTYVRFGPKKE